MSDPTPEPDPADLIPEDAPPLGEWNGEPHPDAPPQEG
jgi:hypothetical protein